MNIVSIRSRIPFAEDTVASRRACPNGVRDIGSSATQRRDYAEEKLNDALRVFRTVLGSPTLVTVLQAKTIAEKRIAALADGRGMGMARSAENSTSMLCNCEGLLRHAGDLLTDVASLLESVDLALASDDRASSAVQPQLAPKAQALAVRLESTLTSVRTQLATLKPR